MKKISSIFLTLIFMVSFSWADINCPADSSYQVDMRTMLPDGRPNPTYGLEISTGLCACVNFINGVDITGSEITFTINIVDNEPIRGIELDIYHDFSDLTYSGVSRGDGNEGELITNNLKTITDIPKLIKSKNFPKDIDIRGEVYIGKKDF